MSVANSVPSKIVMRGTSRMPLHERFGAAPTITIADTGVDEKKPVMGIPPRATRVPRTNHGGMRADEYEDSLPRGGGGGLFQRYAKQPTVQRLPLHSSNNNRDLVRRMEQSLGVGPRGRGAGAYADEYDDLYEDDDAVLVEDYSRLYDNTRNNRWGRRDLNVHQRLGTYGGRITKRYQQPQQQYNRNWNRGGYSQSYARSGRGGAVYSNYNRRQQQNQWRNNMNPFRELDYFTQFTQTGYRGGNRRGGGRWQHNDYESDDEGERRFPQRSWLPNNRRGRGGYRGGRGGFGRGRSNLVKVSSIMNMDEDTKKVYWEQQADLDKQLDAYTRKETVVDDPM